MKKNDTIKRLSVTVPQGEAGSLTKESRFAFNYETPDTDREVSLLMPIRAESYATSDLPSVFAMNRPEGFLLEKITERFGKFITLDDMRLLALTGANQIGRIQYVDPSEKRYALDQEVGLDELLRSGASAELFDHLVNVYLLSGISGFQPKVMVPDADAPSASGAVLHEVDEKVTAVTPELIVKSAGDDYPGLAQNEFLCMEAARIAGLQVPDFWLSEDNGLFIMRRFDLHGQHKQRLGFEDMAVMTGRNANRKYEGSYEGLAKVVSLFCRENKTESLERLFEYVALTVMVRNGDAHLKNFGLLYEHPRAAAPTLSPLFDVVTTSVYPIVDPQSGRALTDRTLALKLQKTKSYPLRKALVDFGRADCMIKRPEIIIDRIAAAMQTALDMHRPRISTTLWTLMSKEWAAGMHSVEPDRFFGPQAKAKMQQAANDDTGLVP